VLSIFNPQFQKILMLHKEIHFSTREEQGKSLREYSRKLSYGERLLLLQELNRRAFGNKSSKENFSQRDEIRIFSKRENETEEEFWQRVRKEKQHLSQRYDSAFSKI